MYLGFTVGNVLQKFAGEPYNILYYPQNNCFDHSLMAIDEHKYFSIINNQAKPVLSTPNLINIHSHDLSLYNYNLAINSNIIGHSQNNTMKNFHLNSIICTHSIKPNFIKKEDLALINQKLQRDAKIFFSEAAWASWKLHNSNLIRYGIHTDFQILNSWDERNKDVLIINTDGSPYGQQIAGALKSINLSGDILNSLSMSIGSLNHLMNQYKIIIDLAEHNIINLLCGIAAGCVGITMSHQTTTIEYENINGLIFIDQPDQLVETIKNAVVEKYDIESNSTDIKNKFQFDRFAELFNSIILKANKEAFIL